MSGGRADTSATSEDRLMTVMQVAADLLVTTSFVYKHAPEMGAIKVGSHLRFRLSDIERWLDTRRMDAEEKDSRSDCHSYVDNRMRAEDQSVIRRRKSRASNG